jgi:hypothetical protein
MKFIIKENKLREIIEKQLDVIFDFDNLHWNTLHDEYGNPGDAYEFYRGDYLDDETVFRLYDETYWSNKDDFRVKLSPLLMFENEDDYKNLNSLFGNRWEPIFKDLFQKKLGFKIKTIDSY